MALPGGWGRRVSFQHSFLLGASDSLLLVFTGSPQMAPPLGWLPNLLFKKHLLITYWVPTFWVWGKGVEIFPVSQGTPCLVEETDH